MANFRPDQPRDQRGRFGALSRAAANVDLMEPPDGHSDSQPDARPAAPQRAAHWDQPAPPGAQRFYETKTTHFVTAGLRHHLSHLREAPGIHDLAVRVASANQSYLADADTERYAEALRAAAEHLLDLREAAGQYVAADPGHARDVVSRQFAAASARADLAHMGDELNRTAYEIETQDPHEAMRTLGDLEAARDAAASVDAEQSGAEQ